MKKVLAIVLALAMLLSVTAAMAEDVSAEVAEMNTALIEAAKALEPSEVLHFETPLEITGMGVHFNNYPTEFDGCYYFPAIQSLTNATITIDWRVQDNYATQVATALASGALPDIINAGDYGVMNLVNEGAVVALDEYLDLIPNIVAAVGEDRMGGLAPGGRPHLHHPHHRECAGSQSVMIRQDWLDALEMDVPTNWDEWVELWRAIKANDLNGNGDPKTNSPGPGAGLQWRAQHGQPANAFGIRASSDCQFCVLDDGTYTMVYEHPRYREFLEAVQACSRKA